VTAYSFQIRNGAQVFQFNKRMPLPSAAAALRQGRSTAWTFMEDLSGAVRDWSSWRLEITDETGRTLVVLPFTHLLKKSGRRELSPAKAATWG
jgi:hypothetical protein